MSNIAEVAVPYAILALHDDNVEITVENVNKILAAAGIEVEAIWVQVFVKAFAGKDIGEMLTRFSAGASAPAAAVAAPAGGAAAPAAAAKEEKKAAAKEESDEDMGFGLFD